MAKEDHMAAHLAKAQITTYKLKNVVFIKAPRTHNNKTDCLAKLASAKETPKGVHIEYLERKSIDKSEEREIAKIQICKCWIDPILNFLKDGTLPEDKRTTKRIRYISNKYLIIDGNLFKREYVIPFLACLHPHQHKQPCWKFTKVYVEGTQMPNHYP